MTRKRSTWNPEEGRTAATRRNADIYTMNQDHPQPSATDYENGDPDSWNETPSDNKSVEKEYESGRVKRNEMGFGEFREDTWSHKDAESWNDGKKYDNMRSAAERRAAACEKIAGAMLRGASQTTVEESASELMSLPDTFIVANLRRLAALDPNTLPERVRFRRSFAATKLAARTLGQLASEEQVEALARIYNGLDDATLRAMLNVAAAVKVAEAAQEEEGAEPKTAAPTAESAAAEQDACGMTSEDLKALDDMLAEAGAPAAPAAPAPMVEAAPAAPMVDDLANLFAPAPGMPAAAPAPMAPAMPLAASDVDINFDDEEGEDPAPAPQAATAGSLDDLFNDLPDVQSQRQLQQAAVEQAQRENGGYGSPSASVRQASVNAKKLGQVRANGASTADDQLASIWDAPR